MIDKDYYKPLSILRAKKNIPYKTEGYIFFIISNNIIVKKADSYSFTHLMPL
ncbi:MAG: hypothetical protein ACJA2G_002131 [Cognaticolwellia sp.]|jgi:hypothetical protein